MVKKLGILAAFKTEFVVVCILALAAFLRLYRIHEYMRFLGDEGRDALAVLHLVRDFHPPLIGPGTSVGNMYLGPLYYYMMAIPMSLTGLHPISAAVMVALIGVATVWLIYYVGKLLFHRTVGIIAALLYATSYLPITMSRSSWNPYPMPFFAMLIILSLYKIAHEHNVRWLLILGASFAFALQMHLLGVILLPLIAVYWAIGFATIRKQPKQRKKYLVFSGLGLGIFLVLMSPLAFFDFRHNFINYKAFMEFFSHRETTVNVNPLNTVGKLYETYTMLYVERFLTWGYAVLGLLLSIIIPFTIGLLSLKKIRDKQYLLSVGLLGLWIIFGILGMTLVKSHIYDHYFGYMMPAIYVAFGLMMWLIADLGLMYRLQAIIITLLFLLLNLTQVLTFTPNDGLEVGGWPQGQLKRTQDIARFVIEASEDKPFNFALISRHNYDDAYQFYLDLWNHPVTVIDPQHFDKTVTDQLFVVCEDPICEPINNDRFEIAAFGWSKIDKQLERNGVQVFRMVRTNPPVEETQ